MNNNKFFNIKLSKYFHNQINKMNPLKDLNNVKIINPLNQLNAVNQAIPVNQINPLNQVKNFINPTESATLNSLTNLNKNESTDKLNTLKSADKLDLLNNQKNPNENDALISDKIDKILYNSSNILANASSYIYVEEPRDVIGDCENAIVMQPTTYLQMVSGCITENEYDVILDSPQGLAYAFYFKEKVVVAVEIVAGNQQDVLICLQILSQLEKH